MKRLLAVLFTIVLACGLTGCRHTPTTHTVCLVDVSKSITPDGINYEFATVDQLVGHMQRGDRLTVIPVTGNAMNDTSGHILRFSAPTSRQPYDHDLTAFRQQAHEQLKGMHESALAHPSSRTDILGALDAAKEEFEAVDEDSGNGGSKRSLIVFSDFLEDDGTYDFASGRFMSSRNAAHTLAGQLQKEHGFVLRNVRVRLANLQSTDSDALTPPRKHAVREFWKMYFAPTSPSAEIQIAVSKQGN